MTKWNSHKAELDTKGENEGPDCMAGLSRVIAKIRWGGQGGNGQKGDQGIPAEVWWVHSTLERPLEVGMGSASGHADRSVKGRIWTQRQVQAWQLWVLAHYPGCLSSQRLCSQGFMIRERVFDHGGHCGRARHQKGRVSVQRTSAQAPHRLRVQPPQISTAAALPIALGPLSETQTAGLEAARNRK